jgi:hypothetical protein
MSLRGAVFDECHLTLTAPSAGVIGTGAYTVAALYMPNTFDSSATIWKAYTSSNFSQRGLYCDGDMWLPSQQADTNIPSFSNPQQWYWFVITKAAITEAPRAHWAVYNASGTLTWSHLDASSNQASDSNINRICLADEFGDEFKGNIACLTAFSHEMSDVEIEELFLRNSSFIIAANPQFFVHWPESIGLGSPFQDIAGGGIESIRSGSWSMSSDPPGFDFNLGRSGKPKIWNGSSWNQHQAKSWNGSLWASSNMNGATAEGWVTSK